MTIQEAYEAMLQGHKVAHNTYDNDEFNFMECTQIKDEHGYHWGLKGVLPWRERVESDWAQEG